MHIFISISAITLALWFALKSLVWSSSVNMLLRCF